MTDTTERKIHELFEAHNSNTNEQLSPESIIDLVEGIKHLVAKDKPIFKVAEFMNTFNQEFPTVPTIPTNKDFNFRLNLIKEELIELAEAGGSEVLTDFGRDLYDSSEHIRYKVENMREHLIPNKVGALDALQDLKYVLYGTILKFGMQDIDADAFEEVHNSNISKACENEVIANLTCDKYKNEGIETILEIKSPSNILVLRASDNKVLKSINYKPAQLDKFIHASI